MTETRRLRSRVARVRLGDEQEGGQTACAVSRTEACPQCVLQAISRAGAITVGNVTDDGSTEETTLGDLGALARRAADARRSERAALEERESAVVGAVRAGARLDEIAESAGVTKAAASAIARKTLAARPGRGGPYRRRRGVAGALSRVDQAAARATVATRSRRRVIAERDVVILAAADEGIAVRSIAEALGMDTKVVHTLIRRRREKATPSQFGTLASP